MVGIKLFEYINFYFRSSIHVVTRHHSCFSAGIQNAKQDLMNNANVVKECLCSKQYHTNTQINILSQKKLHLLRRISTYTWSVYLESPGQYLTIFY